MKKQQASQGTRSVYFISMIVIAVFFILGFAPKEISPSEAIPGVTLSEETNAAVLGSYNLRREYAKVINDDSGTVRNLGLDNPCFSLAGITSYWRFNELKAQPGYKWVVKETLLSGQCLKLVKNK
jgi:hypothetical protein